MNYEGEFKSACERSIEWGLKTPDVKFSPKPILSGIKGARCLQLIQDISSRYKPKEISQQCFWYMLSIKEILQETLSSHLYYTLGYVQYNGKPVFYTTEDELKQRMRVPVLPGAALNLHAWLTTPNMEIIDLTFGTTYGVVNNNPDVIGCCFFQHYTDFDENMIFHPQLVGDDYLKQIGALLEINPLFH
jgi:hypothetical protein